MWYKITDFYIFYGYPISSSEIWPNSFYIVGRENLTICKFGFITMFYENSCDIWTFQYFDILQNWILNIFRDLLPMSIKAKHYMSSILHLFGKLLIINFLCSNWLFFKCNNMSHITCLYAHKNQFLKIKDWRDFQTL